MTSEKIQEIVEENCWNLDYEYIGLRTQEQEFELGSIDHCSKVWDDGNETDEELDGISVTSINSDAGIKMHDKEASPFNYYYGNHTAILASNKAEYGEDMGEIVLKNAVVLYIIK